MAAVIIAACETGSEYTWLLVVFELVLLCLAGSGLENEFSFTMSETSGPGAETELSDHEMDVASRGASDGAFSTLVDFDVVGSSGH